MKICFETKARPQRGTRQGSERRADTGGVARSSLLGERYTEGLGQMRRGRQRLRFSTAPQDAQQINGN